jgi:methylase of polypeptide subunit release factors
LTLAQLIAKTEKRFKAARLHYGHGTDNAHDEAAFLVLRALRLPFSSDLTRAVSVRSATLIESLVKKRIRERLPVAYLLREACGETPNHQYMVDALLAPLAAQPFLYQRKVREMSVDEICAGWHALCDAVLAA